MVYKVRNLLMDKTMAIKVLHSELAGDEQNVLRFAQEANAASLLAHPNLVSVYQSGTTSDGKPNLVMDFVDGRTLDEVIRTEGYLETDRFIDIFKQVCEALVHAHGKGIIHRDLKPSNIMLIERHGEPEMAKLVDFGIARVMQEATRDGPKVTQTGDVIGSPTYMSPEQCLGSELDERSDIYSLGVVMYESLTGKPPFDGDNIIQTILHQVQSNPIPISKARPDLELPVGLEHLIMTALEKSPAQRQAAVDQILPELDKVSDELIAQPRKSRHWQRTRAKLGGKMKSHLSQIVIAASCSLVLAGAYAVFSERSVVDWQSLVQKAEIARDRKDLIRAIELYEKALPQAQANRATPAELAVLNENLDSLYYDLAIDYRGNGTPDKQQKEANEKGLKCAERAIALYDKYPEQLGQPPLKLLNRASFFQSTTGHADAAEKLTRRAIAQFKANPEKTPIKEYIRRLNCTSKPLTGMIGKLKIFCSSLWRGFMQTKNAGTKRKSY
jgi:serine/threonine protein kinase